MVRIVKIGRQEYQLSYAEEQLATIILNDVKFCRDIRHKHFLETRDDIGYFIDSEVFDTVRAAFLKSQQSHEHREAIESLLETALEQISLTSITEYVQDTLLNDYDFGDEDDKEDHYYGY